MEKNFFTKFIDVNQPMTENPITFSTFGILLRGARALSGRNLLNGAYEKNEIDIQTFEKQLYYPNLFNGLINYLILLEQIGCIFKKTTIESSTKNEIQNALENFSVLKEEQISAIRALRNSLTHKYGLATEKEETGKLRHKFTISVERNSEIVKLPITRWDGDFSNKTDDKNTIIYIIDLADLIENVFLKLKEEFYNNDVTVKIEVDELKARFTLAV